MFAIDSWLFVLFTFVYCWFAVVVVVVVCLLWFLLLLELLLLLFLLLPWLSSFVV